MDNYEIYLIVLALFLMPKFYRGFRHGFSCFFSHDYIEESSFSSPRSYAAYYSCTRCDSQYVDKDICF